MDSNSSAPKALHHNRSGDIGGVDRGVDRGGQRSSDAGLLLHYNCSQQIAKSGDELICPQILSPKVSPKQNPGAQIKVSICNRSHP